MKEVACMILSQVMYSYIEIGGCEDYIFKHHEILYVEQSRKANKYIDTVFANFV